MPFLLFDDTWPLVRTTFVADCADAELDGFLRALQRVLERRRPYVVVTDARHSGSLSAVARRSLSEFVAKHAAAFDAYQLAHGVVMTSSVQRGILTALSWFGRVPGNVQAFDHHAAALHWVDERWRIATGRSLHDVQFSRDQRRPL